MMMQAALALVHAVPLASAMVLEASLASVVVQAASLRWSWYGSRLW
jgi:hypothetical protein